MVERSGVGPPVASLLRVGADRRGRGPGPQSGWARKLELRCGALLGLSSCAAAEGSGGALRPERSAAEAGVMTGEEVSEVSSRPGLPPRLWRPGAEGWGGAEAAAEPGRTAAPGLPAYGSASRPGGRNPPAPRARASASRSRRRRSRPLCPRRCRSHRCGAHSPPVGPSSACRARPRLPLARFLPRALFLLRSPPELGQAALSWQAGWASVRAGGWVWKGL